MEEAHEEGKICAIGVSNFLVKDLDNILDNGHIPPEVNQILVHAGNTPVELLDYCQAKDILVEAYSPIAHGKSLKSATVRGIAERYGVTIPQLCIRYTLQLGTVSLPKTSNPVHMRSKAQLDFEISAEDMEVLRNFDEED